MLINETHLSNQHVEVVRLLLDSEFLITELKVLAYFTHKVTLPFLYFVEMNAQESLLDMLPCLYRDLKNGSMDTLQQYIVHYPHIEVSTPSSSLSNKILQQMILFE